MSPKTLKITSNGRKILGLIMLILLSGWSVRAQNTPNIIFILADDLGWTDLGCYGNTFNETPEIDKLSRNGVRFTSAYAAAPVCSPYRAALLTGQYPARLGITDYLRPDSDQHLDTELTTLPEMLQANGYHTGIVGKWHLSGYVKEGANEETLPDRHGFDEVIVSENRGIGAGSYFYPYHFNKEIEKKLPGKHEYLVDRQQHEALEFIERNKKEPFFLYVSHYAVHTYVHGKPEDVDYFRNKDEAQKSSPHKNNPQNDPYKKWPADFRAKNNNPHLAAQLLSIDQGVGAIMDKLKELGLDQNTIVIFTSDNGGEINVTDNSPLRGGKSMLYEGGVRVPLIVLNPFITSGIELIEEPVMNVDFYPTIMGWTGISQPNQPFDGKSLTQLLVGAKKSKPRNLFWHYPLDKQHFLGGRSSGSVLSGKWKLIEFYDTKEVALYNLEIDIGEKKNISDEFPEKTAELYQDLQHWRNSVLLEGEE